MQSAPWRNERKDRKRQRSTMGFLMRMKNGEDGQTDLQKYAREMFVPAQAPCRERLLPFCHFLAHIPACIDPRGAWLLTFLLIMNTEHTVMLMTEASITIFDTMFWFSASALCRFFLKTCYSPVLTGSKGMWEEWQQYCWQRDSKKGADPCWYRQ